MPTRPAGLAPLVLLSLATLAAAQGAPPARPAPAATQRPPAAGTPLSPPAKGTALAPPAAAAPALALRSAWTTELPASPSGAPAFDARHAYVPLRDGRFTAVGLERGSVTWTAEAPAAAVAAGDGLVFLATGDAVEARRAATGEREWIYEPGEELAPALSWDGGWLLASTVDGDALMLGARDGKLLWRQALAARPATRPAMTADRLYLALEDGRVVARQITDGSGIWERRLGGRPAALSALDDRLFVGADDKYLYCLDTKDGDQKWRWRTGGAVTGTPAVGGDRVYFVAFDNVLRALDRGNGHQRWMRPLGFRPTGGPLLVNGLLLVPSLSPELAVFRADTGARAGTVPAGAEPVATPHVLYPASAGPGEVTLVVVGRTGRIERLGPAPPVLQAKPIPGAPMYLMPDMPNVESRPLQISTGIGWPAISAFTTFARRRTPSTILSCDGSENDSRMVLRPVPSTKKALPAT
ncbi:MAG: PQQ-like beta-propeller repeat protein [Acidobacteria bacterium]|nr:PQQ-like beta-propeller repeat protein [Acidobacteriota bacterium]